MATDEVASMMSGDPNVWGSGITDEELTRVTQGNFEQLLDKLTAVDVATVVTGGVGAKAVVGIWPFAVAYGRDAITRDQLTQACTRILPETGVTLASRLVYVVALGPYCESRLTSRLAHRSRAVCCVRHNILFSDAQRREQAYRQTRDVYHQIV